MLDNIYKVYKDEIYLDYEQLIGKDLNITLTDKVLIIEDDNTLYCYHNIKGYTPFNYKLYDTIYLSDEEFKKVKLSKFSKYQYNDEIVKRNERIWHILKFREASEIHSQSQLDLLIDELTLKKEKRKLLLHSCCGPCSSYCLEYLHQAFKITIFYENSNIDSLDEFNKRVKTQKQIIDSLGYDIDMVVCDYQPKNYFQAIKGLEHLGEFSQRCYNCYQFRLEEAARYAKKEGFDFFSTTLSISPYKNSTWINEIGLELEKKYQVKFLYSNFKLHDGYKESVKLSQKYRLYRQDYCGCIYSKKEMENERNKN